MKLTHGVAGESTNMHTTYSEEWRACTSLYNGGLCIWRIQKKKEVFTYKIRLVHIRTHTRANIHPTTLAAWTGCDGNARTANWTWAEAKCSVWLNWFYFIWNRAVAWCAGLSFVTTPPKIPMSQLLDIERIRRHYYDWKRQRYVVFTSTRKCLQQLLVRSQGETHGTSTKQCYHLAINRHIKS